MLIDRDKPFQYLCCSCHSGEICKSWRKMSLQKKNVIQGFLNEDYVPSGDQFVVKYCSGKGNNLHEVECVEGSTILVSMPKKFRHTVWLKKDDCLVIDPIEEGKKVKGEIVCVLPISTVRDLITTNQWPVKNAGDNNDQTKILEFFTSRTEKKKTDDNDTYPPSESEEDEDEQDDGEEGEEVEEEEEEDTEEGAISDDEVPREVDDDTRTRNRSRVQLVSSGVVTVTNVITEGLENDIQSLEFEADEESSDELSNRTDAERHANTIRIQVNYDNANGEENNEQ